MPSKILAKTYNYGIAKTTDHQRPYPGTSFHNVITNNGGVYLGPDEKVIYLTFDCGYENGYTGQILDVLEKTNTKALFFITGHYLSSSVDLVKRMDKDGHLIGNHSYNHINYSKESNEKIEQDAIRLEKSYYELTGNELSKYIRPPEGAISDSSAEFLNEKGYKMVFWSLAYVDWYKDKFYGNNYSYNTIMERYHNGAIILMHTVSKDNATDLENIILSLKNEGYKFGSISSIL